MCLVLPVSNVSCLLLIRSPRTWGYVDRHPLRRLPLVKATRMLGTSQVSRCVYGATIFLRWVEHAADRAPR